MKLRRVAPGRYQIGNTNWFIVRWPMPWWDEEKQKECIEMVWDVIEERNNDRYAEAHPFRTLKEARLHFLKSVLGKKPL